MAIIRGVTERAVAVVIGLWHIELRVPDSLVQDMQSALEPFVPDGMRVDVKPLGHQAQYCTRITFIDPRR